MDDPGKLKWHCRRGTLELDLLLGNYLENAYTLADAHEQQTFLQLLRLEDTELQPYLMGDRLPEVNALAALVKKIRALNTEIARNSAT